ncbi:MAG: CoA protein activase, partial [Bacillota bacterium]
NIPFLTFFLDEQTGKAGMTTRLEAFVDLLRRRKQIRQAV